MCPVHFGRISLQKQERKRGMKYGELSWVSDVHESDGEESTDNGDGVKDVPQVTTVRAGMKQDAAIHHLYT